MSASNINVSLHILFGPYYPAYVFFGVRIIGIKLATNTHYMYVHDHTVELKAKLGQKHVRVCNKSCLIP